MNRYWMLAVVAVTLTTGLAQADFGGPLAPPPQSGNHGGLTYGQQDPGARERYGLHPMIRRVVWWKSDAGGCTNCGPNGGAAQAGPAPMGGYPTPGGYGMPGGYGTGMGAGMPGGYGAGMGAGMPGTPAAQMPGTLVFPNHWYSRSPRDFFMYDAPRR